MILVSSRPNFSFLVIFSGLRFKTNSTFLNVSTINATVPVPPKTIKN